MNNKNKAIYSEIKERLTIDYLKRITIDIITSYRNRNFDQLKKYVTALGMDPGIHNARLFSMLIKKFHPDRLSFILKQVDELFVSNDFDALTRLHGNYFFNISAVRSIPDTDFEFEQECVFDEKDFGYGETDISDKGDFGETNLDFGDEEPGFLEVLNRLFFGGLDVAIAESDLMNLEGELDLSDFDMCDLSGIEHCIYLNALNLSNNRIEKIGNLSSLVDLYYLYLSNNQIENISPLEKLVHLKELDISFNNITDIRILENLNDLEYVNLLGNPICDISAVDRLMKKGVIVILDHQSICPLTDPTVENA
ncbi:MAG: leucine-rich repeat domain-containing protein [Chrysiogenales bacterium]|nr:MAG: leucine-rich repeat domain-containing protein [Chrysiogenales bacterium]